MWETCDVSRDGRNIAGYITWCVTRQWKRQQEVVPASYEAKITLLLLLPFMLMLTLRRT
jgi:hypothetical protein